MSYYKAKTQFKIKEKKFLQNLTQKNSAVLFLHCTVVSELFTIFRIYLSSNYFLFLETTTAAAAIAAGTIAIAIPVGLFSSPGLEVVLPRNASTFLTVTM